MSSLVLPRTSLPAEFQCMTSIFAGHSMIGRRLAAVRRWCNPLHTLSNSHSGG